MSSVTVNREALLTVVRRLDIDAKYTREEFAHAFDQLRAVFSPEEIATGAPNDARPPLPEGVEGSPVSDEVREALHAGERGLACAMSIIKGLDLVGPRASFVAGMHKKLTAALSRLSQEKNGSETESKRGES